MTISVMMDNHDELHMTPTVNMMEVSNHMVTVIADHVVAGGHYTCCRTV